MKIALTIAGTDSGGGAGIAADVRTFAVLGVFGATAITAVTAQNTLGIQGGKEGIVELDKEMVRRQIDAVAGDFQIDATKSGMLASVGIIEVVEDCIKRNKLQPYVCDPVMVAKSGDKLIADDAVAAMKKRLFPLAAVVTPNRREAATLAGSTAEALESVAGGKDVAKRVIDMGAKAVVVKGFVVGTDVVDLFYDGREFLEFTGKLHDSKKTHGSGCAFSAAITAGLASRLSLVDAIDQAKNLVNHAIQYSDGEGRGTSPVNVLAFAPKKKK
jgi:hydroxymethylpyrimidine/phosphomethylpyrimidine kinase